MSFSDPRQPFMPSLQSYVPGSDAISIWPQFSIETEDQTLDFDPNAPPFKRARNSESEERQSANRMIPANAPTNKGLNNIFFKTRLCAKFKLGLCRNGENCNFAHGVEDMRQPPPNWQEMVGLREEDHHHHHRPAPNNNWDDDQKIIHRMRICKKYYNGEDCPYGDRCNFLHEDLSRYRDDSGRFRESSVISIGTSVAVSASTTMVVQGSGSLSVNAGDDNKAGLSNHVNGSDSLGGIVKPSYWRTKLCNKWEQTGHCPFGDKCHFAHGFPELQASSGRESEAPGVCLATHHQLSTNDSLLYAPTNAGVFSEEARANKRCLLRWKGLKKINRIYGDWLDDLPIAHNIPSRVES